MPSRVLRYLDGILRGLLVTLFAVAGAMKLIAYPFEVQSFAHFGYESWFMYTIGVIELGGAVALLVSQWVLPAAALLAAVLVGALYSHLHAGDAPSAMAPAVIALAVLLGLAAIRWPRRARHQTGCSAAGEDGMPL